MLIFDFIEYMALFALQLRSSNVGVKLPFLLMVIPKYLYSLTLSNILSRIVNICFPYGYF